MFQYTEMIGMVENGIKPLHMFEGKPPEMKLQQLAKRHDTEVEIESGTIMSVSLYPGSLFFYSNPSRVGSVLAEMEVMAIQRIMKVGREHNEDCKHLLKLMGIPYIDVSQPIVVAIPAADSNS